MLNHPMDTLPCVEYFTFDYLLVILESDLDTECIQQTIIQFDLIRVTCN